MNKFSLSSFIDKFASVFEYAIFGIIILYFVIGQLTLPAEREDFQEKLVVFPGNWTYVGPGEERPLDSLPVQIDNYRFDTFIIESEIPYIDTVGKSLIIRSSQQDIEFRIGGKVRAVYDTTDSRFIGKTSPSAYAFCPLEEDDAGKTVQIRLHSVSQYANRAAAVYICSSTEFWMAMLQTYSFENVLAFFLFIVGIASVAIGVFIRKKYRFSQLLEPFGWILVFTAGITLTESRLRQLLVPNASTMAHCTYFLLPPMMLAICRYLDLLQAKRYTRLYNILGSICIAFELLLPLLVLTDLLELFQSTWVSLVLSIIILICMAVVFVIEIKKKYIIQYLNVALAILILGVCAITGNIMANVTFTISSLGTIFSLALANLLLVTVIQTMKNLVTEMKMRQSEKVEKQARERFFASIAHDIRTPLNGILGMNEMILRESREPDIQERAQVISTSGQTLLSLVNDLLDFSKAEAGKLSLQPAPFSPTKMVNDLLDIFEPLTEKKSLTLNFDVARTLPVSLTGDELRIRQILTNLLSNAVKYTSAGSVSIDVSGKFFNSETGSKYLLAVCVADTGQGIRPENMGRLFTSYTRFEESENHEIEGTGLGLGISKQLADLMDGKIEVWSEFGTGSRFTLMVPLPTENAEPAGEFIRTRRTAVRESVAAEPSIEAPGRRILAIDDNPINLEVIKGLLRRSGIAVDTALSGPQGIEKAHSVHYDVIFIDHFMPGMDGIETMQQLRLDMTAASFGTPLIALTGNAGPESRTEYIKTGFNDYLSKPVSEKDLNEILRKLLLDRA